MPPPDIPKENPAPKTVQEVEIAGRVYIATGDYPDGRYVLEIKAKGAKPLTQKEFRAAAVQNADINWQALKTTDTGKAMILLLCLQTGLSEEELTGAAQ